MYGETGARHFPDKEVSFFTNGTVDAAGEKVDRQILNLSSSK